MPLVDTLNEVADLARQQQLPQPGANPPPPKPTNAAPVAAPSAAVEAPATAPPKEGFIGRVVSAAKASLSAANLNEGTEGAIPAAAVPKGTVPALGAAILRAPGQFQGGLADTVLDAGKFVGDNIDHAFARKPGTTAANIVKAGVKSGSPLGTLGGAVLGSLLAGRAPGASLADVMSQRKTLGQVGNQGINQGATELVSSIAGIAGGEPETALPQLEKVIGPRAAKYVTQLAASSAKQGAAFGVSADAPDLATRGKNAAEAAAVNAVAEPILSAIPAMLRNAGTKVTTATPEEAAQDALDRAFATQRTSEARQKAGEALAKGEQPEGEPQEVVNEGTRHADGSSGVDGGVAHPLTQDANAALDKAGAAERLPEDQPPKLTPDGRILVEPATKDAADKAGFGRAFAAANEADTPKDPVIFKEEDAQGGKRVVGIMDKYDLQEFKNSAEAYAKEGSLDTPADSHVGQWRLGNLGASYDVGARGRALTDYLEGSQRPRSDEELFTQAKRIADDTGLDPKDVLRLGQEWAGATKDADTGMLAVRMVQARVLKDLEPHASIDWATLHPEDPRIQDGLAAVHNALTFHAYVEEGKTGMGRGLRAAGLPAHFPDWETFKANFGRTPDADLAPKDPLNPMGLPRTPKELDDWFKLFSVAKNSDDPEILNAFLRGQSISADGWRYLRNSFPNFFTAAIVSAPRTLVRDIWGPAIVSGMNTIGRISAGGIQAINPFLSASERALAWSTSWGAARAYAMTMGDSLTALKYAAQTASRGFTKGAEGADHPLDVFGSHQPQLAGVLGGHNPIDWNVRGYPRALIQAAVETSGLKGLANQIPFWGGNMVNKFPQAIHALHGGVNEFAQRLSYLGEVRAGAYNEAARLGYTGEQFDRFVRDSVMNSTDEAGKYTDQGSFDAAERTSFVRRPNENDPIWLQKATQFRNEMIEHEPFVRFVLPIFTVPANALGETLRRVPVLNLAFSQTRDELLGRAGIPAQVDAYGRTLTGASALTAGLLMARTGQLTGAGPSDPTDRALWLTTHQPYSIKAGSNWYSYAKSDILGPMLGIMAGLHDQTVYQSADHPEGAMGAAAALAEYFKDQASLQTLSEVLNIGGDPNSSGKDIERLLGSTAGGFIPNFIVQLGRETTDDLQHIKRSPWDYIKDRLPGASQTLDPVRNLMGEMVHKPHSPGFNTFPVSLSPVNTFDKDPVLDELTRLYQSTGYAPGLLSPAGGADAHFDMRDVKLEDGHSLYDALNRGRLTSTIDGQTLRERLGDIINSGDYLAAPDGTGKSGLDPFDKLDTRGGMISKAFADYNKQIKRDVANASPTAARWMAVAAAKGTSNATLRAYPAEQLVKDPSLMDALGIHINDFEEKVKGQ